MRRATALVVAAGLLAVALTGCSSNPNASCDGALPSGKASDLVTATGKIGGTPKIEVPAPIDTTTSQRTILTEGTGEKVQRNQMLEVTYSVVNGETGEVAGSSSAKQLYATGTDAISKGLLCAPVGSRVAIVVSPKDSGADAGSGSPSPIYVIDVVKAFLPAANGAVRPSVSGFPTVVLAPTGQPGITIPSSGGAPTTVRSELLKQGDGAEVKKDSQAILQYTAVGWEQKNVVTSSWTTSPDLVDIASGQSSLQNQSSSVLPQSMLKELVGQKVGSQVVIETPKDSAFPAAAWVVDILGVR
ncbi:peptidylprolyl isomerase [Leifsonia sp. 71-9]|uniref:peptidylprolyl isomerase n=1 Tax=Leifsonia sp. 71-9 TaxID=1895934 RepID=UPI000928A008|nr:peptidylprolyl isomerase [Leifsonia sp. 71-9]OJX76717.1 MAG: peptidylprolyl isomerase [Leifsonia sp. 71-9]